LTLVEVVAGLVLLATLLASILVAFGSQAAQIRAARDRMAAIDMADRLLSEWTSQNAIPAVGTQQSLPGTENWSWRVVANKSAELERTGVSSVCVQVFRSPQTGTERVLASVDVIVPGNAGAAH
jgi:type II secretory pathway pseudopilin PulG